MDAERLSPNHLHLVRALEAIATLSDEDRRAIATLPLRVQTIPEDRDIVSEGDSPNESCLVLEGFVCRYKRWQERRQILSFHLPGDIPDLQSLHLEKMDHAVSALTPARVAYIPHEALRRLTAERPSLTGIFWRSTLIDSSRFREWITGLGTRTAYERMAHLFCEIFVRMVAIGVADEKGFELPATQAEISDALGITTVHVNRVLQEMRRDGLITSKGRFHGIESWPKLRDAAAFDPTYLHLNPSNAAARMLAG